MIDINKFHGQGKDIRTWLNQPFAINGRICATNGHVMVILHNQDCSGYAPLADNQSGIIRVIDNIESASDYAPIAKDQIAWPGKINCHTCKGCGHATKEECEECEGGGTVDISNDYSTYCDLECESCGGIGYKIETLTDQPCEECEGSGKAFEKDAAVEILGININAKYLSLIIDEPHLQFRVSTDKRMLMFADGENTFGAIMGLRMP